MNIPQIDPTSRLPIFATSVAFAVALVLALPQPVEIGLWAVGTAVGVVLSWIGFQATARSRPPVSLRRPMERLKLGSLSGAAGAALGAFLLGMLVFLARFEPAVRARFVARLDEPGWRPWVLGVESSILEEVTFRLFLLSAVAWLAGRFLRSPEGSRPFLAGLLVSTLAFGLAHLPAWAAATSVHGPLVAVVLALNGLAGLLFGWVFWRWGLVYAILCHFAGDVVIQALGPRILS